MLEQGEEGINNDASGQHHYGGMCDLSELSRMVGGTVIGIGADEKAKKGESTPRKRSLVWAEGTTASSLRFSHKQWIRMAAPWRQALEKLAARLESDCVSRDRAHKGQFKVGRAEFGPAIMVDGGGQSRPGWQKGIT
ncbi:hypothetical protein H4219_005791 [Mycoemilia scoparia]|uniref:Uncharacterized protein n=1 Tax=Mycoemilia scoparia TaxID=417184 RepID=A0A9W7ZMY9_9FUNG|nr:hypothetical protein H4219_005791 [Mycoemilia scoparia]